MLLFYLTFLHTLTACYLYASAVTGLQCKWFHWPQGSVNGCRQGQVATGGQAASSSTAGAAPAGTAVPNPATSSDLNARPTGNAASNAASGSGQGVQTQQPKAVPNSATSAQAGSFGTLRMHGLQLDMPIFTSRHRGLTNACTCKQCKQMSAVP